MRTTAPARLFAGLPEPRVRRWDVELDRGAVEADALTIDAPKTAQAVEDALRRRDALVAQDLEFIRRQNVNLILADVPFLAGEIAAAARLPCVAVTNFTWDWIYQPFLDPHLWEPVAAAYGNMQALLRMPFSGCSDRIRQVIDVPLVTRRSRRPPDRTLRQLFLTGPPRGRGRILVALRGGVGDDALSAAARSAPELEFLCAQPIPGNAPANLKEVHVGPDLDFSDLLAVSDAAVSKLGYGTVAECIASNSALLWPPRTGFREDEVVRRDGPRYLRMRGISRDDFEAGNWGPGLRGLLSSLPPPETMLTDGAEVCARWIVDRL